MGVFHSWSRTWIFEMGISALLIGCWSAYYPEALKNLHNLTCKPSSPVSQSFTQIIQQRCSTDAFRNYTWFAVLCYPCYPFKYAFLLHISSHTLLNTPLLLLQTSNTSVKQSKKKSDLQMIHSNRLSSFHLGTHLRNSLQQIFGLYYTCSIQKLLYTSKPPKSQQWPSCPTHYAERSSNMPFTGWIRQRYSNAISVSCPPRLDGEMLSSRSGI